MLLFLYRHSFTLSVPAPPQTISPSLISQLTRRRLWHCGGSTWLWAASPPAAAIRQWPPLGGRMGRCCMMQKCKTTPGIRRESWSTPLCFISSMSTSPMRGATSVWSQITLGPTTPTGPSLQLMVRMFALFFFTLSLKSFFLFNFFYWFLLCLHSGDGCCRKHYVFSRFFPYVHTFVPFSLVISQERFEGSSSNVAQIVQLDPSMNW